MTPWPAYRDWVVLPVVAFAGTAIVVGGCILLAADGVVRAWDAVRR